MAHPFDLSETQFRRALHNVKKRSQNVRAFACMAYAAHLIGEGTECDAAMALAGYRNHTNFNKRFFECLGCRPSDCRGRKTRLLIAS